MNRYPIRLQPRRRLTLWSSLRIAGAAERDEVALSCENRPFLLGAAGWAHMQQTQQAAALEVKAAGPADMLLAQDTRMQHQ